MCSGFSCAFAFFLSVKELDSSQLKELQAALKGFVQKNETLKLETKVSTKVKLLCLSQGNNICQQI